MIDPDLHVHGLHYNCQGCMAGAELDTYRDMIGDEQDPAEFDRDDFADALAEDHVGRQEWLDGVPDDYERQI